MAEPEVPEGDDAPKKKGGGLIMTIIIVLILSAVAGGGGWYVGGMLSGKFITQEKKDEIAKKSAEASAGGHEAAGPEKKPGEDSLPHLATAENGVVALEPITANLAYPSENWIRIEVALMFADKPDEKTSEEIHQDIMAYLRTVSLTQIQSARGFEHLRDDIKERAEIRSEGRIKDVMFRTFIVE